MQDVKGEITERNFLIASIMKQIYKKCVTLNSYKNAIKKTQKSKGENDV